MSRTIKQLVPGTTIWIGYNGTLEEWLVTNDINANRVIILRKYVLETARRMHSSNVSVYDGCEMDVWLENDIDGYLAGFDSAVLACFTATSIQTYTYGQTGTTDIARRCFLPSGDNMFDDSSIETELSWLPSLYLAYETSNANTARIGRKKSDNTAQNWWLRSPFNATQFRFVNNNGAASNNNASSNYFVRPALSVSADTLVSDEGADIIKLLADQSITYREVEFTGFIGSMQQRPAKARVISNAVNLYDVNVWVSNNAKDAEPVWVNATGGGEVTLNNASHTTAEYEIGVKCYGKSKYGSNGAVGYFNEPVVLIEEA